MLKNILIAGGSGFIGTHFLSDWFAGHCGPTAFVHVYNVDLQAGSYNKFAPYRFLQHDVADEVFIKSLFTSNNIDTVINLIGPTDVRSSLLASYTLIDAANWYWGNHRTGFKDKRFIQAGSGKVYGGHPNGALVLGSEYSPFKPGNPQAAQMAAIELFAEGYRKAYGMPIITTRACNVFGPDQSQDKLIPTVIRSLMIGKLIRLYGDGSQVRDWMYVDNYVDALEFVLFAGKTGEAYNVCANNEISNRCLVEKIINIYCDITGQSKRAVEFFRLIQNVEAPPGHEPQYVMSGMKLRNLGWKSRYSEKNCKLFDADLYHTVKAYCNIELA